MIITFVPPSPLGTAIARFRMEWSGLANTQSMLRAMTQAANAEAQLCVFPVLAVTGFHRQIRAEAEPIQVQAVSDRGSVRANDSRNPVALGCVANLTTIDDSGLLVVLDPPEIDCLWQTL